MKKLGYFLIVLFSFFIASGKVSAQDPTNCTSSTVAGYNAYASRSISTLDKVCSYRPLGVNPSDLNSPQGITYMEIFNLQNGNGDIYYFMEVNEKLTGKDYKLLVCTIKKPDGVKETHTDKGLDDVEVRFFTEENEVFQTKTVTENPEILYEFVDGFEGVTGTSSGSDHDNKHACPAYAGKIYAPSADGFEASYSAAFIPRDYYGNTQWPTVANTFSNFTTAYKGGLTWHASNAFSDSVTVDGQNGDMVTTSQAQYTRSFTNNSIASAVNNSTHVSDWDSCNQYGVLKTLDIVHTALLILRIMVPLFLIIFGSIDFGKAGISGDDDLISKATKTLVRRGILGIVIFFIPTITYSLVNLAGDRNNSNDDTFYKCAACFTGDNMCENYMEQAEGKVEIK